jgi:hypothetical protein
MTPPPSPELDRLLARGRLGGPARERILDAVLARTARPAPAWRRRALVVGLAAAAPALMLLLVRAQRPGEGDALQPKGERAPAVQLDLRCSEGTLGACPQGATLLFGAVGAPAGGYLAAFAQPEAGGARIWYFSAESEAPPLGSAQPGTRVATRGIRLGPEHAPGRYQVQVWLTAQPVPRAGLLVAGPPPGTLARAAFTLVVVGPAVGR